MNYENFFFFFFSSIALLSAIFVIYSINTIYSVFFLILVFINFTGLLLIFEMEFISIMLIIIYVGAITVLFLFIIMMLDINLLINKKINFGYIPIISLLTFLFISETFIMLSKLFTSYHNNIDFFSQLSRYYPKIKKPFIYKDQTIFLDSITNAETLGQVLYTHYFFFFILSGLILLIALIGAVTLTKKKKKNNIDFFSQLSRNYLKSTFNIKKQP
jgi:NADH-quinone oxidoreductase subunit J